MHEEPTSADGRDVPQPGFDTQLFTEEVVIQYY